MKNSFKQAAAEKGLGFFSLNLKEENIIWEEETSSAMGSNAEKEKSVLASYLTSSLRSYVLNGLANRSNERLRCIIPLMGDVMEVVILPPGENSGDIREGFFNPYPLHIKMELMKKYFLSNISNTLRSLLNSVIIASDVIATAEKEILLGDKFLSLMAEDAREVNSLLNRMGEIINYSPPEGTGSTEEIDIKDLLSVIHDNLHYLAEDASISMSVALPEGIPPLRGNFTVYLMTLFLAIHHALSKTEALGEIIITARDLKKWILEIGFSNSDIPSDATLYPEKHGLVPVVPGGWSESAALQLIDALLGLSGGELTVLENKQGLGLLMLPLPTS